MSKFDSGRFSNTRGARDEGFRVVNGYTTKLHNGQQGKHLIGHNNYIPGRSILTITLEHAQKLVETYAGTGIWWRPNKETIDFHEIIGIWVDPRGSGGLLTTIGTIHYGKKGCHLVPAHPMGKGKNND